MKREKKISALYNAIVREVNKSGVPEQETLLVLELIKDEVVRAFKVKAGL